MWRRFLINLNKKEILSRQTHIPSQIAATDSITDDVISDIHRIKIGENIHGFSLEKVKKIEEFNLTAFKLIHKRTQAEYLHLFRNDRNNVFSICFRTTPKDSTGLPHILEHMVLCGSDLYPVRDPFFKMLNRSLATFMNALTGSDYTIYPFSTQNLTDFRNLQKIYLDAVFRPSLKDLDFMQEGWRLENIDPNDRNSEIIIKGVVYNEMKGTFSENDNILVQKLQNLILPDHTYGVVSGGDPLEIPNLSWEDLVEFHKECYHPSNAKFFSYGNFPLIPTLEYLEDEYLRACKFRGNSDTYVPNQKRWEEPKQVHIYGRYENLKEPLEKQNSICISFAMSDITDLYSTFVLHFLSELLIKGPNAPFYKSMIEPNFSGGFTPCTGYDNQTRDSIFTIGLQGLKKEDFGRVIKTFDDTIDDVIKNGFNEKHIESVLHQYELSIKHETKNFGLTILFGMTPLWNHNGDVIKALEINNLIKRLKEEMAKDKEYLQKIIKSYFKENKHKLILTMSADKDYEQKQDELEKALIKQKTANLTFEEKEAIYLKGQELLEQQSTKESTEILPSVYMDDIDTEIERTPMEKIRVGPVSTQVNIVNTNGITYFKGILSTSELTLEQQMLVPLLCYVITKLGTAKYNYRNFDNLINLKTAGLNVSVHHAESLFQLHSYEPGICISSHCLDCNIETMFELWQEIFNLTTFNDVKRFEMLTQLYIANLSHGVADNGHLYAMQAAAGLVSGSEYQKDLLTGLQHILYMKHLVQTRNFEAMLKEISNIIKLVFDKNKLRCALNVSKENKAQALKLYHKFVNDLPGNVFGTPNENNYCTSKVWAPTDAVHCQHYTLCVPVYFCSKAILTVPFTNPDYPILRILARLLSSRYLHPELREKNGAYGSGAKISPSGVFSFYSYRDPRHFQTLDTFDKSLNWLEKEVHEEILAEEILEAKLGVFQSVDAPIPPSLKGCDEFSTGLTRDMLQRHRIALMTVTQTPLMEVASKYLGKANSLQSSKVIVGPKSDKLDTTKRIGELWTVYENN